MPTRCHGIRACESLFGPATTSDPTLKISFKFLTVLIPSPRYKRWLLYSLSTPRLILPQGHFAPFILHRYSSFILLSCPGPTPEYSISLRRSLTRVTHTFISLSLQMLAAISPPSHNISQSIPYTHSPTRSSALLDPVSPVENKVCPGCHLTVMDENGGVVIAFG